MHLTFLYLYGAYKRAIEMDESTTFLRLEFIPMAINHRLAGKLTALAERKVQSRNILGRREKGLNAPLT
jgi:hypothetical protein